jgi:hypothetical protein
MNPTPPKIRYRKDTVMSSIFESKEEEVEAMQEFAQAMMDETSQESAMDCLLVLANVCEMRASLVPPEHSNFYDDIAQVVRASLGVLTYLPNSVGPDERFENPRLYSSNTYIH